jgi:hypothetical protein
MRRRVLAVLVLALMLVAMMAFAGLAFAQPPEGSGCHGIDTARGASAGRQGPPAGKGPPTFTEDLPAGDNARPFGGCPPPPE